MIRLEAAPVRTASLPATPTEPPDVFTRNLRLMVSQIAGDRARETLQMLEQGFPDLRDFEKLRVFSKLYVEGGMKPLQVQPLPSAVEPDLLRHDLAVRLHEGSLILGPGERIVCRGSEAFGPFDAATAMRISRQLSSESPTNDKQGHVLDPEKYQPPVVGIFPEMA